MGKEIITEQLMKDVVAKSYESIKEKVSESLLDEVASSLKWRLKDEYAEAISEFMKNEIKPELESLLVENKAALITAISGQIDELGKALGEAMRERIVKDLTNDGGWKTKKILNEIF